MLRSIVPRLQCAAVALLSLVALCPRAQAQSWIKRYQQRTSRFTAQQPHWAGPVITTVPMLVQVFREDFSHLHSTTGVPSWNLGVSKGLQLVPLPRTELTVTMPPWFTHTDGTADGFGDMLASAKFRIAAAPEGKGNYIATALLNATVPTGTYRNGAPDATVVPQIVGGKGWGRWDTVLSLAASLPVQHAAANGRVLNGNSALQYHLFRYVWPELETTSTTWFGSSRDGKVQTFLAPGIVIGRLPYKPGEKDRRRGVSVGAAFQIAVTPKPTFNHAFTVTTRLHF